MGGVPKCLVGFFGYGKYSQIYNLNPIWKSATNQILTGITYTPVAGTIWGHGLDYTN